uniref:CCHC-type domain-containing protein n=1 Tax=Oryza punctata TaxID=4537 RepID=A0A0E0M5S8_ORYPU
MQRVQLLLKHEECTIGLNNLKQYPTNESYHLTPTGRKGNITCFGCGEKGHYANKYPKKKSWKWTEKEFGLEPNMEYNCRNVTNTNATFDKLKSHNYGNQGEMAVAPLVDNLDSMR